jgi:hypothetical protein
MIFCLAHPSGRCFKLDRSRINRTRGAIVQSTFAASPYIN